MNVFECLSVYMRVVESEGEKERVRVCCVRVVCVYVVPAVAVSSSTDAAALRPTRDEREDLREAGSVGTEEEEQVRVAERCDVKDRGSWNPCACLWVVQRERQRGRAQLSKVYHI